MGCVSDATFSKLAGVSPADDHDGVPSIDSIDQCKSTHIECAPYCRSCTIIAGHLGCILPRAPATIVRTGPAISGAGGAPPRTEIFIAGSFNPHTHTGDGVLIQGAWKLVATGPGDAQWSGPLYPKVPADGPKGLNCSFKTPCCAPPHLPNCCAGVAANLLRLRSVPSGDRPVGARGRGGGQPVCGEQDAGAACGAGSRRVRGGEPDQEFEHGLRGDSEEWRL